MAGLDPAIHAVAIGLGSLVSDCRAVTAWITRSSRVMTARGWDT
jgi:hypothetical protein